MFLNSVWGKLAQNPNLPQVAVIKDYAEYWKIIGDEKYEVLGEYMPNDETILLNYRLKDAENADPGCTTTAIASFVTSYARLHLYKFIEKVVAINKNRLLYFDTDSIVFIHIPGDPIIECGDYLGDLTDEIKDTYGPTAKCTEFATLGPKSYAYAVDVDGKQTTVVKTKGIRNDFKTLELLTMDGFMRCVQANLTCKTTRWGFNLPQWRIKSDKVHHRVQGVNFKKRIEMTSDKRNTFNYATYPIGYWHKAPVVHMY